MSCPCYRISPNNYIYKTQSNSLRKKGDVETNSRCSGYEIISYIDHIYIHIPFAGLRCVEAESVCHGVFVIIHIIIPWASWTYVFLRWAVLLYFKGHTPVRLVGGNLPSEGRVEMQYHGVWGTVCSQGFTASDGDVICRMIGFNDSCVYYFNQLKEISLFTRAKRLTKWDREHRK